jgi:predicted N-acetyltransferase YhbS
MMHTSKSNVCPARSVRVRLANAEDAAAITIIVNSAFRRAEGYFVDEDRVDVASVLNSLDRGKFLLAENEDMLLGCVYVEPCPVNSGHSSPDRIYLGLLAVDPGHQQSGLGSVLMDAAEEYGAGLGAGFMDLKVVSLREELFGFYRKRGYVETGTSPFPADVETKLPCHFIEMSKPLNQAKE